MIATLLEIKQMKSGKFRIEATVDDQRIIILNLDTEPCKAEAVTILAEAYEERG